MTRLVALMLLGAIGVAGWIAWSGVAGRAPYPEVTDTAEPPPVRAEAPTTPEPSTAEVVEPPQADVVAQPPASRVEPRLEVVRVEQDDSALVAGVGEPDSDVAVVVDGETVVEMRTDAEGNFVGFLDLPRSDDVRRVDVVTAENAREGGQGSSPVFISPSTRSDPEPEADVPLVVAMREEGAEVLQRPQQAEDAPVAIDIVSYERDGLLAASGRGNMLRLVRLYANAQLVAETLVAEDGTWSIETTAALPPGQNTLRVDEIAQDGSVRSRIEAPFTAPQIDDPFLEPGEIMVERGETLWALAEQAYGDGFRFTTIYRANADRIRDPDLIFPGQILTIPSTSVRP